MPDDDKKEEERVRSILMKILQNGPPGKAQTARDIEEKRQRLVKQLHGVDPKNVAYPQIHAKISERIAACDEQIKSLDKDDA